MRPSLSRRDLLRHLGLAAAFPLVADIALAAGGKAKARPGGEEPSADGVGNGGEYGGWGGGVTGGTGKTVQAGNARELTDALVKGNCTILLTAEVALDKPITTKADNITLDGQGNTIRGDKLSRVVQMLNFEGCGNILIKNVRLRNGGDNVQFKGCDGVCLHHVSTTGAGDDGISFSYGSKNGTISHCFIAGCTRSIFLKYLNTSRVSIHHTVIMKHWERGPLIDGVNEYDFRNNLIMDWKDYGTCSMPNASGNLMGNLYVLHDYAKGKKDSAINTASGNVHIKDNVFQGCTAKPTVKSRASEPIPCPNIVPAYTTDAASLERTLLSATNGAGCMPRDAIDTAYIEAKEWTVNHDVPFRPAISLPK